MRVILLPGLDTRGQVWGEVKRILSIKKINFFEIALPEYGSKYGKGKFNFETYCEYLDGKLGKEKAPFVLVGHSLGGLVAVVYAAKNPGRVRGLVVSSAPLRSLKDEAPIDYKLFIEISYRWEWFRKFMRYVFEHAGFLPEQAKIHKPFLTSNNLLASINCYKDLLSFDFEKYVRGVKCRTVVLYGKEDAPLRKMGGTGLYSKFKNTEIVVTNGSHSIPKQFPEIIADKIIGLL